MEALSECIFFFLINFPSSQTNWTQSNANFHYYFYIQATNKWHLHDTHHRQIKKINTSAWIVFSVFRSLLALLQANANRYLTFCCCCFGFRCCHFWMTLFVRSLELFLVRYAFSFAKQTVVLLPSNGMDL